jgi:hypothetical protein
MTRSDRTWALLLAVVLGGCIPPFTDPVSKDGGTEVDAGAEDASDASASSCETNRACADCATCAASTACASPISACKQSPGCVGIDQCFVACSGDLECQQQCYLANPDGVDGYEAVTKCVYCAQCPNACKGYRTCP